MVNLVRVEQLDKDEEAGESDLVVGLRRPVLERILEDAVRDFEEARDGGVELEVSEDFPLHFFDLGYTKLIFCCPF